MFSLHSKTFPDNASAFGRALDESLHHFAHKEGPIVAVSSRVFPYFDTIDINFDKARFDSSVPPKPSIIGEAKPACEAANVLISARDILIHGVPLSVRMQARGVVFHKAQGSDDNVILIVKGMRDGQLVISADQLALEKAIREIARREAKQLGVTVEEVRLSLRARSARSIAADAHVHARKLLFGANIDLSGKIDIDDKFAVKVTDLKCKGEGTIGSLACNAITPHLQRLNDQTFSLLSLPIGEVELRDIRVTVADTIEITADFGGTTA